MGSVLKNVYIDKLDNIINKFNSADDSGIKIKPVGVKSGTNIDFGIKKMKNNLILRLVTM